MRPAWSSLISLLAQMNSRMNYIFILASSIWLMLLCSFGRGKGVHALTKSYFLTTLTSWEQCCICAQGGILLVILQICDIYCFSYRNSLFYGKEYHEDGSFSYGFYVERHLEFCASLIEVIASIGWVLVWYTEYQDKYGRNYYPTPGRGWTCDDPDLSANITIILASVLYLIYNCQINTDEGIEKTNNLYVLGDVVYLLNAVLYVLASLRDCGWFWFMPSWGRFLPIEEARQRFLIESGENINHIPQVSTHSAEEE